MKKNKIKAAVSKFVTIPIITPFGIVKFDVESFIEQVQWSFEKVGRQLEISFFAKLENLQLYKQLHNNWFGTNFIKDNFLHGDQLIYIDELFDTIKQKKVLFDVMLIEADICYEDPGDNFYSEFSHYHGIGLTVNGKKYLKLP